MTENFPLSLIILLPLLGAVLNLLLGRRLGNTFVSLVACSAVAGAALVATKAVLLVASDLPMRGALVDQLVSGDWIVAGDFSRVLLKHPMNELGRFSLTSSATPTRPRNW